MGEEIPLREVALTNTPIYLVGRDGNARRLIGALSQRARAQ